MRAATWTGINMNATRTLGPVESATLRSPASDIKHSTDPARSRPGRRSQPLLTQQWKHLWASNAPVPVPELSSPPARPVVHAGPARPQIIPPPGSSPDGLLGWAAQTASRDTTRPDVSRSGSNSAEDFLREAGGGAPHLRQNTLFNNRQTEPVNSVHCIRRPHKR